MKKRNVVIDGFRTAVSVEDEFWRELKRMAARENTTLGEQVRLASCDLPTHNRSSAVRCYVLKRVREKHDDRRRTAEGVQETHQGRPLADDREAPGQGRP